MVAGLPPRRRPAGRRLRRRAVPVQGHDAAGLGDRRHLRARATPRCSSTRACPTTWSSGWSSTLDLRRADRRHPRHGVQGRQRRPSIEPVLPAQAGAVLPGPRVLTTDPYVTDDPDLLPLEQVLAESDVLVHRPRRTRRTATSGQLTSPWSTSGTCRATGCWYERPASRVVVIPPTGRTRASPGSWTGSSRGSPSSSRSWSSSTIPHDSDGRRRRASHAGSRSAGPHPGQHVRPRTGQRHPVRHRPRAATRSSWSRWPTAATTRG